MENNSQGIGERVWSVAEQAGAERRKKIDTTINRVLGLPEAAGKLVEIGSEAVKAKATEIKDKAVDLKERTEKKIIETKDKLVDRYESARDSLISRVEAFKKKASDKATELKNRAVRAGITAGLGIEDRIVKILELPAGLKEKKAGKFDTEASSAEKTKRETMVQQIAELNGLNEAQQEALRAFLASQREEKESLIEEHSNVRAEIDKSIEVAKAKSSELKTSATETRNKVESKRVFKGLLAKIS